MKMPAAIQNTGQKRLSIWRAKGPWGSNESSGAFSTFGWTNAHAERAIARTERPRRRRDRDRDLIGPHHTVPPGYDQSRPPDRFFGVGDRPAASLVFYLRFPTVVNQRTAGPLAGVQR